MNKDLISLKDVTKSYDNGMISAIQNIDLTLEEGKIYALMGPSGCGKSTLLNLIGTLDTPDTGTVYYEERLLDEIDDINVFRRDFLGFIFQFHHLVSVLTLGENVETALLSKKGLTASQRKQRSHALLQEIGLAHRINAYASEISGGERQRGAIARALVNRPRLILADEPTGNVDSTTATKILKILRRHVDETKATILVATHDVNVAKIADVLILMEDGKIISTKRQ